MEDAATGLVIDWRLLVIQAVNFLLLLGILWWVVWRPLLRIIDERRQTIEGGLTAAREQQQLLQQTKAEHDEILARARKTAITLVAEAREERQTERQAFQAELRRAKRDHLIKMERVTTLEETKLKAELRNYAAHLITSAVARILPQISVDQTVTDQTLKKMIKEIKSNQ